MQQIRIFIGREDEHDALEKKINEWIRDSKVKVLSIQGNIAPQSPSSHPSNRPAPSDVLLIVTYDAEPGLTTAAPKEEAESIESFDDASFPLHSSF